MCFHDLGHTILYLINKFIMDQTGLVFTESKEIPQLGFQHQVKFPLPKSSLRALLINTLALSLTVIKGQPLIFPSYCAAFISFMHLCIHLFIHLTRNTHPFNQKIKVYIPSSKLNHCAIQAWVQHGKYIGKTENSLFHFLH